MALSTMNSSAKRMWQKFFLLFRIAVMSPHCSKTSWMISSVAFSGNPPTKTVLHPGGRSLVEGGGRSENHNKTQGVLPFTYFCSIYLFFFSFLWFTWQKSHSQTNFLHSERWWTSRHGWVCPVFSACLLPTSLLLSAPSYGVAMPVHEQR